MTTDEYNHYHGKLYAYLYRKCPHDWIEDIIQDCMLRWWMKRETVIDMDAWLFITARNRMVDMFRLSRNGHTAELMGRDSCPSPEKSITDRLVMDEALCALRAMLSPQQEELLEELMDTPVSAFGRFTLPRGALLRLANQNGETLNAVKARKNRMQNKARRIRWMLDATPAP